ncbi:MAG: signal peptidase I [Trueperella sp.]|nr:signal peptidase I [Trueperella sp.]
MGADQNPQNAELAQMPPSFEPSAEAGEERIAAAQARAEAEAEAKNSPRSLWAWLLEIFTIIGIALLLSVLVKTFLFQAFEIPSESMENTFVPGDRIIVNKLADSAEDLNRGDPVVFVDPGNWLHQSLSPELSPAAEKLQNIGVAIGILPQNIGKHLVKRIIGMPGDRVACCNQGGLITVNGAPIVEDYLKDGVAPSAEEFDVTVPAGHVWVLGDNRINSQDSRYHQAHTGFGFVPIKNIEGRVWAIVYPFDRMERLPSVAQTFVNVPDPE